MLIIKVLKVLKVLSFFWSWFLMLCRINSEGSGSLDRQLLDRHPLHRQATSPTSHFTDTPLHRHPLHQHPLHDTNLTDTHFTNNHKTDNHKTDNYKTDNYKIDNYKTDKLQWEGFSWSDKLRLIYVTNWLGYKNKWL